MNRRYWCIVRDGPATIGEPPPQTLYVGHAHAPFVSSIDQATWYSSLSDAYWMLPRFQNATRSWRVVPIVGEVAREDVIDRLPIAVRGTVAVVQPLI